MTRHTPVMLEECIDAMNILPGGKYVDATYGLGGHSKAIAKAGGMVLAMEWDSESYRKQLKKIEDSNILLINANYGDIKKNIQKYSWKPCKGVIFDLGLSMDQIRSSKRGFSYKAGDEPLDMRIGSDIVYTAADIVNSSSKEELYDIFSRYAEELSSRAISEAVYSASRLKQIRTVKDMVGAIGSVKKGTKTFARIFQALRIVVNDEYRNIEDGLLGAYGELEKDGRIAILTFHSGEDRLVKKIISENNMHQLTKKPVVSKDAKVFERSAKLRILVK